MSAIGDTSMDATVAVTTVVLVPLFPPSEAVIVAVPGLTAVTKPLEVTVATVVGADVHMTVALVTTLPRLSRTMTLKLKLRARAQRVVLR